MKFGRKSQPAPDATTEPSGEAADNTSTAPAAPAAPAAPEEPRTDGPFDESQVAGDGINRVDLGSMLIVPSEGRELRLQVDESTGVVQAVMIAGPDGAL